jgi:hypothetical protein
MQPPQAVQAMQRPMMPTRPMPQASPRAMMPMQAAQAQRGMLAQAMQRPGQPMPQHPEPDADERGGPPDMDPDDFMRTQQGKGNEPERAIDPRMMAEMMQAAAPQPAPAPAEDRQQQLAQWSMLGGQQKAPPQQWSMMPPAANPDQDVERQKWAMLAQQAQGRAKGGYR